MSCRGAMKLGVKMTRPILSADICEAHRRVIGLYRAFYRFIPYLLKYQDIPKTHEDCRWKLREYFYKNACITDVRVIDVLVLKGYMELKEITHQWQMKYHLMNHWHPTIDPKPCGFIAKFLHGKD